MLLSLYYLQHAPRGSNCNPSGRPMRSRQPFDACLLRPHQILQILPQEKLVQQHWVSLYAWDVHQLCWNNQSKCRVERVREKAILPSVLVTSLYTLWNMWTYWSRIQIKAEGLKRQVIPRGPTETHNACSRDSVWEEVSFQAAWAPDESPPTSLHDLSTCQ